jgi:hypothetical protein
MAGTEMSMLQYASEKQANKGIQGEVQSIIEENWPPSFHPEFGRRTSMQLVSSTHEIPTIFLK